MTTVNQEIYDNAINRAAMVRLWERRLNGKVELLINDHSVRVDKLIREANLSVKGFETLREAIDKDLSKTFRTVYRHSNKSLIDFAKDQLSYTFQNIESSVGEIWRTNKPTRSVAENIVLKQPLVSNRTLASNWAGISLGEKKRIEALIRKGISEGLSVEKIALNIRKGNIFNITRNQSKSLVVTAITSVHSQVDQSVYEVNSKAINGWQYVAVLDSRTTPLCAHRDGTIYPTSDTVHLPPAHISCRSTTVPVFKSWDDMSKLEGVAQIRRRNLQKLSPEQIKKYDGQTPLKESYNEWLLRQPKNVQLKHLGDYQKVDMFNKGDLELKKFTNPEGNSIGLNELKSMTSFNVPGDTHKFALAKEKLDSMQLGISHPEDLLGDVKLQQTLKDYYLLQSGELDGTLSTTNYRGVLVHNKKAARKYVLNNPPTEEQLKFNPITRRYEDTRMYQPNPYVLFNNLRLVEDSTDLLKKDKLFISKFVGGLETQMGVNERAVVTDNLRTLFVRYRKNPEPWTNFKAVSQSQIKFDVMNVSDAIETQIRKDTDALKRLLQDNYIDPVLGVTQLDDLHDNFIKNIIAKNKWEDTVAPQIALELRGVPNIFGRFTELLTPKAFKEIIGILDKSIIKENPIVWKRLNESSLQQFYTRMAHRLSLADSPDLDQFAVALGRDLYTLANLNGDRKKWYDMGMAITNNPHTKKFFEIETFGVQKRRMKSRLSSNYFGQFYDTMSYNIRVTDPRIQEYAHLTRKVDVGLRVGVTNEKNRLYFREGYKTYFAKSRVGYYDTRIPITSTASFSDFPAEFIDKDMVDALNWTSGAKYKIDPDFYDFTKKLLYFVDDKGKAEFYNELNDYKKYLGSRGDTYERFKSMEWLRGNGKAFSNHAFIDHRARVYDRGFIGPQSGETFRPFLNTAEVKNFSRNDFYNFQDQIGAFLGGLNDYFEGRHFSLTITGRQKVAERWRNELVTIGNQMRRGKPNDIRTILKNDFLSRVDAEEKGKVFRFAIESAKIDEFLGGNYSAENLLRLKDYKTALALEQDASSSGAQIIALTTKNKQLAEMSNVVPTHQKRRLYDEVASLTFDDPRFKILNQRLGLTEKDLRKAQLGPCKIM